MSKIVEFKIQGHEFAADVIDDIEAGYEVKSSPRPYGVFFPATDAPAENLAALIAAEKHPLLLLDETIGKIYFPAASPWPTVPMMTITANEDAKQIGTVLNVIDFLERNGATKSSMLFVVGGGVLQDVGAFAAYMYKRGIPWTFVPTTLLAQGDSCVGGKTALNYKNTKNLLALFSAPRRVIINTGFLASLPQEDLYSGVGEIFRLSITGGPAMVDRFEALLPAFLANDKGGIRKMIAGSLSIKRAVVEFDEFELDIRRSMNYGHSFGHALEALSNYQIPHGIGVTIGILVENQIGFGRGLLGQNERDRLVALGRQIIGENSRRIFGQTSLDGFLDLFRRDKKTEGMVLKLATLASIGDMRFIDFKLDADGDSELRRAVATVLADI